MSFLNSEDSPGVDFDDLHKAWEDLSHVEKAIAVKEFALESLRAFYKQETLRTATGKKPSMAELDQLVTYLGREGHPEDQRAIAELKETLANLYEAKTSLKGALDIMNKKISLYQTRSANMRRVLIE